MFNRPRSRPAAAALAGMQAPLRNAHRWGVARIVLLYAGFAALWILLSDRLVRLLLHEPMAMMVASSMKGMAFILITSALLYATLNRYVQGLAASEQKFSNIFHMSPDAIDLTHIDTGILVELNQSYIKMFGYGREELIGRSTLPSDLGIWVRTEDRDQHVAELLARGIVLKDNPKGTKWEMKR